MVRLVELLNSITESDTIFMVLVVILIVTSLAMVYLIYEQNKEMKQAYLRRQQEQREDEESTRKVIENFESIKDKEQTQVVETNDDSLDKVEYFTDEDREIGPDLVPLSDSNIPDKLDYTQALWLNDSYELENIKQELLKDNKDVKVNLTPYEEEQESKAIISYDELIDASKKERKVDTNDNDDFIPIVKSNKNNKYYHEEEFLYELKELKRRLG